MKTEKMESFIQNRAAKRLSRQVSPEEKPKGELFIKIQYKLLDNPDFRNKFMKQGMSRTYYRMMRFVVRDIKPYDPLDIYSSYWANGHLATDIPASKLARDLGLPITTVRSHIIKLEKEGIIKIDRLEADETPDGKQHNVFILGTWKNGYEQWFIEDVFTNNANKGGEAMKTAKKLEPINKKDFVKEREYDDG